MITLAVIIGVLSALITLLSLQCYRLSKERDEAQLNEMAARHDVSQLETVIRTLRKINE